MPILKFYKSISDYELGNAYDIVRAFENALINHPDCVYQCIYCNVAPVRNHVPLKVFHKRLNKVRFV